MEIQIGTGLVSIYSVYLVYVIQEYICLYVYSVYYRLLLDNNFRLIRLHKYSQKHTRERNGANNTNTPKDLIRLTNKSNCQIGS